MNIKSPTLRGSAVSTTRAVLFSLTLLAAFIPPANAQQSPTAEPSRQPFLRIETGMHTAAIRRIGVDSANRYLVTASDDKTVRVWELPSGRLLRVLRVPVGAGDEGKMYAVAISPDGSTIAAGGWTSQDGRNANIYLFDRESGRMIHRIRGLPDVVPHLAYSPDGRYLAATLGGGYGVRVFDTAKYDLAGADRNYGDISYGADFDHTGRLVTTSLDGFVRLYAPASNGTLRLIAKQKSEGEKKPYSVSFSHNCVRLPPNSTCIAVGFLNSPRVAVLSGTDLSLLYMPDTAGVNDNLSLIAWSADGRTLYAGGQAGDAYHNTLIRAWADGGLGSYRDIAAATSTIQHIVPLRGGGVAYGALDPAFGMIAASGERQPFPSAHIADYRDNKLGFRLAPDGVGIAFGYQQFGRSPARFSLSERRLDATPAGEVNWRAPVTEAEGLRVTDWSGTYEPKLNGAPLKLEQNEFSYSVAIAPDRSAFLLGTIFYIRLFNRSGNEVWPEPVPVPGVTWALNISPDGRLAVAAFGDGTIRWYSMKDGKELLAFFPHADKKRWVVWTPSGYYDASPGGEDLIGWHVNNGRDRAADFFPVGKFRDAFYRPDVVAKVLKTLDEGLALKEANDERGLRQQEAQANIIKTRPPVVEIVSPKDGAAVASAELAVRFRVRSPSGEPVTTLRALIDGRPAAIERDLNLSAATGEFERELRVTLPEQAAAVSIIAENRFAASEPSTVRVTRTASVRRDSPVDPSFPQPTIEVLKPKLYVLAIGVSEYPGASMKLRYAAKDARDFSSAVNNQAGGLYREVEIKLLTDGLANRNNIVDGLQWLRRQTTKKDVAMVFFAGHGVNDDDGTFYFLPIDVDVTRLWSTGVAKSDFERAVQSIVGKTLLFLDTCHSGNVLGTGRRDPFATDITRLVNELTSAENGAVVFASSTGRQYSLENPAWGNGAFTKALVEGLSGKAAIGSNPQITIALLEHYIYEEVKRLTGGSQTPTTTKPKTITDFPIAVRRR